MRNFTLAILVIIALLNTSKAHAETLLFYEDFWPFSYTQDTQTKGLYFDIVTAVFESMETAYTVNTYPFKRSLINAIEGNGVVVGIFKTDERALKLDFSQPFYHEESVLFINKDKSFPYNNIEDLQGKRLGIKLGWSYGSEFDAAKDSNVFNTTVGSPQQIYRLLNLKRLDAVVDNKVSGINTLNSLRLSDKIEALPQHLVLGGIYIAVKKGTNSALLERFNTHVSRIKSTGQYDKILAKYYKPAEPSAASEGK